MLLVIGLHHFHQANPSAYCIFSVNRVCPLLICLPLWPLAKLQFCAGNNVVVHVIFRLSRLVFIYLRQSFCLLFCSCFLYIKIIGLLVVLFINIFTQAFRKCFFFLKRPFLINNCKILPCLCTYSLKFKMHIQKFCMETLLAFITKEFSIL